MKSPLFALSCALLLSLAACGGADSESVEGPVSSSPLTGTFEGAAFDAKIAIADAFTFDDGTRMISIYDADTTCADANQLEVNFILVSVPWEDGYASDFSFGKQTATFVVPAADTTHNYVATEGRVELTKLPASPTEDGELRLRATYQDNHVEGAVPLRLCE